MCYAVLSVLSSFAIISLAEEERASCFTVIVLFLSCDCKCSVSLPHGAAGWSAVCDCGISWSYSLTFYKIHTFKGFTIFEISK